MELLNILKNIILEESRLTLGSFTDVDGDTFFVVATTVRNNIENYSSLKL